MVVEAVLGGWALVGGRRIGRGAGVRNVGSLRVASTTRSSLWRQQNKLSALAAALALPIQYCLVPRDGPFEVPHSAPDVHDCRIEAQSG